MRTRKTRSNPKDDREQQMTGLMTLANDIQEVRAAILRMQPRIFEYDPGPRRDLDPGAPANNHETSTRYLIIDPVLRSLGRDLSDPRDCIVEYRVVEGSQRAVDYALLDGSGNSAILIEAKRIDGYSDDVENLEQIYGYMLDVETARIIVSTNGQYWDIEIRDEGHPRNDRRGWVMENDHPLGLHWRDVDETAERLHRHLDRSRYRQ